MCWRKLIRLLFILAILVVPQFLFPGQSCALPGELSSPEPGVVCNVSEKICYDRYGPSIAFTETFMGEEASEILLEQLKDSSSVELFGYRIDLSPGVYFLKMEEVCFSNEKANRELTETIFGKDAAERINRKTKPQSPSFWRWEETIYYNKDRGIPGDPDNYTLRFLPDGRIDIKADCNYAGGVFKVRGKGLSIHVTHSTLALCPPPSLYDKFLYDLNEVKAYDIDGSCLYLDLGDGSALMKFRR